MKVKTLVEHGNSFGDSYTKEPGVEYDCDEGTAAALVRDKLVQVVDAEQPASRAKK